MNLLIAPLSQGVLLGAVFPTTGMREIPKSRLLQVDPTMRQKILNAIPQLRTLPEPQLSQAIMQVLRRQQQFQALQGGGTPLPNAAAISQQQQLQLQQQQNQQQQQASHAQQ
jgi:mediator of RNA polymerase II transcription subunit 25